ncbi:transposase [Nesterenkonia pannonica]|uniref:transposase n=1 Tax=Nesterenkonia pannonica TaxID=1548602 RepID=UPI00216456B3|nr:transposase [Nesterenkonia pannonica]
MAGKYPEEFREDVVAVANNREAGVSLKQIAADFGISYATLTNWMRQDATDAGEREGRTTNQRDELRELRWRNRLLEQENLVLRRAAAYLSQANLPSKALPARR